MPTLLAIGVGVVGGQSGGGAAIGGGVGPRGLAALTGWILPWVAMLFNAANYLVIVTLLELVELLAALPFAAVEVPRPGRLSRLLCDTLLAWAAIAR